MVLTAVFLDGPLALQQMAVQFSPTIRVPIRKHLPRLGFYETTDMLPLFEEMVYYCVALGHERKVAIYSLTPGDRSLLQLAVEETHRVSY